MRAVFLDKDGTLLEDVPYNVDPARGYFAEAALAGVERRLRELLAECGVELAGFYYCPHYPNGSVPAFATICDCRKPAPGMLLKAAREQDIDLTRSWLVGDILDDIEAGRRAGCRTVLLDSGHETEWVRSPLRTPDLVARDLAEAARLICAQMQGRGTHERRAPALD
jgi:HAD superfamily hydrolase (TIGR01662 family)